MALITPQSLLSTSPMTLTKSPILQSFIPRRASLSLRHQSSYVSLRSSVSNLNHSSKVAREELSLKYVYPDPIPEFAEAEGVKFRGEILKRLSKERDEFGGSLNEVVGVCKQILTDFLRKEYGGPGTLVVEPFTYMLVALKEKNLPGAPLAARTSLLWAQKHLDEDWEIWNTSLKK